MQLYRFFKKPELNEEDRSDGIPVSEKYPLYAITCDKKLAKRFQEERDMNKFIVRKSKVDKEEFAEFALQNRQSVLTLQKLTTVSSEKIKRPIEVQVLLTQMEYQFCADLTIPITDDYWWTTVNIASPFLFNDGIKKSLDQIDYINLFLLYNGDMDYYDKKGYTPPSWDFDQLSYFIFLFGDLFKIV